MLPANVYISSRQDFPETALASPSWMRLTAHCRTWQKALILAPSMLVFSDDMLHETRVLESNQCSYRFRLRHERP